MTVIDLTTYDGLIDTVKQYLNRRDLDDQVPAFIAQATAKLSRELRVRDMMTRAQATTTGEYITLPSDFRLMHTLELATAGQTQWGEPLRFISEEEARQLRSGNLNYGGTTLIQGWTIFGNEIELVPAQTANIDFRLKYYAAIPALSSLVTSNWLLLKSPDLYVVSACLEAALFLKNDERLGTWNAVRSQIMDAMQIESDRATRPNNSLAARRVGF